VPGLGGLSQNLSGMRLCLLTEDSATCFEISAQALRCQRPNLEGKEAAQAVRVLLVDLGSDKTALPHIVRNCFQ
jgi:hypothetical protein